MDELKPNFSESEILANKITDNLKDSANIPNPDMVKLAATGYANLLEEGLIHKGSPLSIIDFSLPSTEKRLWIVDPDTGAWTPYVYWQFLRWWLPIAIPASGLALACMFLNRPGD